MSAFSRSESEERSGTLLRFWNRGTELLGFSVTEPRLLEALYDSGGRPLVLASIAEHGASENGEVEVLAVEFSDGRLTGVRLQLMTDSVGQLDNKELRAYRRFNGPPYMAAVTSRENAATGVVKRFPWQLSPSDETKAGLLAARLWELRCPGGQPATEAP